MWSGVVETLLKIMSVILPSLFSYQAGKKSVESDIKDNIIEQSEIGNAVDEKIRDSHYDPIARNRLRDKWRR